MPTLPLLRSIVPNLSPVDDFIGNYLEHSVNEQLCVASLRVLCSTLERHLQDVKLIMNEIAR